MPVIVVDSVNQKPTANSPDVAKSLHMTPVANRVRGGQSKTQRSGFPRNHAPNSAWGTREHRRCTV